MTKILQGDCLEVMKTMENNSVDTIITDPPYWLSFMGKKRDYDVPSVEIWQEALRVLKPWGTALIFAGSRTQHRMACNVEDAGFILKDTIMWMYGSWFPKASDCAKQLEKKWLNEEAKLRDWRKSHGLKPSYEPILVCQKPNDWTYANNAIKRGVSWLWIEWGRIGTWELKKQKAKGSNWWEAYWEYNLDAEYTPSTQWRFPANTILTHNAECKYLGVKEVKGTGERKKTWDIKIWITKFCWDSPHKWFWENWKENVSLYECHTDCPVAVLDRQSWVSKSTPDKRDEPSSTGDSGIYHKGFKRKPNGVNDKWWASRFFKQTERDPTIDRIIYKAKASKKERNAGCEGLEAKTIESDFGSGDIAIKRSERVHPKMQNIHPTVKPISVMEYLCMLTKTPTWWVVLDPFAWSGTTWIACKNTWRDCILIEREEEYIEIIKKRLQTPRRNNRRGFN
jgi:site-specific DNA-methyltransferase (adenine-specific)